MYTAVNADTRWWITRLGRAGEVDVDASNGREERERVAVPCDVRRCMRIRRECVMVRVWALESVWTEAVHRSPPSLPFLSLLLLNAYPTVTRPSSTAACTPTRASMIL